MNYQDLVAELGNLGKVTSKDIAARLGKPVKEISNDLRRLKKMGLVENDREERTCFIGQGKTCHKGYQYIWYLSKQGQGYLKWMKETKPLEDAVYLKLMNEIAEDLPSERRQSIVAYLLTRATYKYNGPCRRLGFFNDHTAIIALVLSENRRLMEENRKLAWKMVDLSLDCERKITEIEQKDVRIFLGFFSETEKRQCAERQQSLQDLAIVAHTAKEIGESYRYTQDVMQKELRKYAPPAVYIKTLESVSGAERVTLNLINLDLRLHERIRARQSEPH